MCPSEAGEIQGVVVVEGGGERKGMVGMVGIMGFEGMLGMLGILGIGILGVFPIMGRMVLQYILLFSYKNISIRNHLQQEAT